MSGCAALGGRDSCDAPMSTRADLSERLYVGGPHVCFCETKPLSRVISVACVFLDQQLPSFPKPLRRSTGSPPVRFALPPSQTPPTLFRALCNQGAHLNSCPFLLATAVTPLWNSNLNLVRVGALLSAGVHGGGDVVIRVTGYDRAIRKISVGIGAGVDLAVGAG